ncbi:MAG: Oxygen-dependent choline dehydrogenase [Alphaproteobacteria bacterium MarineAlpha11_Bin1]|nr:MAG: Oxygen-dependent choline dehydrogenase [Alphaproteobacteria bacterium MarineAlpha11_Bin1]|tara:strand:- start:4767 stop:6407 length:1641 start_codon:yes stop_codon:yes gene_type:complete
MTEFNQTVDYIVVGAGSAGCVLTHRLSEDSSNRVLTLEAGDRDKSFMIHMPLGVGQIWHDPKYNWSYESEPEPHVDNRRLFHPRGKVLGGSSSINMMAYVRGNHADYDRWRQKGMTGWSFDDILPYFKRAEAFQDRNDPYHGSNGPWKIRTTDTKDPIFETFFTAVDQAGFERATDYNGASQQGFARLQVNAVNGRRQSAAVAYLHPAMKRPNVEVQVRAHVTRILLQNGRAIGVEYIQNGRKRAVRAEKEVILSGGSINSPQVLMLSGVGPAGDLSEMGVDVVHDLPGVGNDLQDHPAIGIEYNYIGNSQFHRDLRLDRLTYHVARAKLFGTGMAASPPSSLTGYVKSRPELEIPDIQIFFRSMSMSAKQWFPGIMPAAEQTYAFRACHLRPESRGRVSLRSLDPEDPVRILNNFLSTDEDRRVLRESFRIMRKLGTQPAFDEFRGAEFAPGDQLNTDDDDAVDAYIRETLSTVFHPTSTCRMGVDDTAVVDNQLNVYGIDALRVVDASIMPDIIGGNLNATVIMIAEKASDIILGRPAPAAAAA